MTVQELVNQLKAGKTLDEAFPYRVFGQDCDIFKTDWPEHPELHLEDICYIPDVYLNEIPYDKSYPDSNEMIDILENVYTIEDFYREAWENWSFAHYLFDMCDWQHPNAEDELEYLTLEEVQDKFHLILPEGLEKSVGQCI